ncbi:hypothetical protein ACG0Z6_02505 [Roseateles sp. BYS180W]|uniref:ATPase n=1 Tax=Roseateles rivi TaxID=3299028 RepID=A0ABW7FS01_9BURK
MTANTTAQDQGSATTNPNGPTQVQVHVEPPDGLLLFDPQRNQLLSVPKEHVQAFLAEANAMEALCLQLLQAKQEIHAAQEALAELSEQRFPPLGLQTELTQRLTAAQKKYDQAYEKIKNELGDQGYLTGASNGRELMSLLPLAMRQKPGQPAQPWGRKATYVRSEKMKNHWRTYNLSAADTRQNDSFVRNGQIDRQALKDQFTKITPKLKAEWGLAAGHFFPQLQSWAEALRSERKLDDNGNLLFKSEAHLFRYFLGCGLEGSWSPKEGKVFGKANAKAEVQVARAEAALECVFPSQTGWVWALVGPKSGKTFHIGAMRLMATIKVGAGAGASLAVELAVELDYSATKAGAAGPAVRGRRSKPTPPTTQLNLSKYTVSASAGAEVFAGVKASGELVGGLQFLNPEKGDKFDFMASVGPKLEGQMGVGAGANLMVNFEKGRFMVRAKAALCLGLGAKGEIALEINGRRVVSFLQWFFHALLNVGFEYLEVVHRDAYRQATRLAVLMVEGGETAYEKLTTSWAEFVDDLSDGMAREDRRVALMNKILGNPVALRLATPEAHGILLWQMSRHGFLTKTTHAAENSEGMEMLGRRKRAIYLICTWAQCRSQFENMVQHMGPEGAKSDFKANYQHLLNFMEIGPMDSKWDTKLQQLYDRLPSDPARGYALVQNDTNQFMAQVAMGNSFLYLAQLRGATLIPDNLA